jgi:hypothetical protein
MFGSGYLGSSSVTLSSSSKKSSISFTSVLATINAFYSEITLQLQSIDKALQDSYDRRIIYEKVLEFEQTISKISKVSYTRIQNLCCLN